MSDLSSITATADAAEIGRKRLVAAFAVAATVSLLLPLVPWGRTALYPFALLGTWAHEMGHGMVGELVGDFDKLVLFKNLGGYALVSRDNGLESVLVSAGGLLGPAVVGGVMIWMAAKERLARWALGVLSVAILLSVAIYVRSVFGFFAMLAIGLVLALIAFKGPTLMRIAVAGFIGIQLCLASWGDRHYMFTKNFVRDGEVNDSDTQNIADEWFLPYWFWGGLILALSIAIMAYSFYMAWLKPLTADD